MTYARLVRSLHLLFAATAAAGLVACGSSNGGIADGGVYGGADGSDMGGSTDAPIKGPLDAMSLDDAGKTSTCTALQAYAKCNTSDPCADLDAKDCIAFDGIYSTAGRTAVSSCYGASGACTGGESSVTGCLYSASLAATVDSTQKKLATAFCAACPDGSACADNFYGAEPDDAGNVGLGATLGLALVNDSTIEMIQSMCVTGLKGGAEDCGFAFAQCAGPIINPGQCSEIMMTTGDAGPDADPGGA